MILIDLYQKGFGILKKFPSVNTEKEAKDFIESYCKNHNVHIVARERCGDAMWNYLSNGTEIDYCAE